jgi:hypothetical protein
MRIFPATEHGAIARDDIMLNLHQSTEIWDDFRKLQGLAGVNLFDSVKTLTNSKYSEELTVIAGSLLHDELKEGVSNDESKILSKVEIKEINGDGLELEVVVCSSSYCWLQLVSATFPKYCRDSDSLCQALLNIYDCALHDNDDENVPRDYTFLPEFLASARSLMNGEFVDYLEEVVNKLGESDGAGDEHVQNIHVMSIDDEGFNCEADICRELECYRLTFRVRFPRKAHNSQELQAEIVECLGEGACAIDWSSIDCAY